MAKISDRVASFGTTIFSEINQLAQQHNALNLGQGRPDFDAPPDILAEIVRAVQSGAHNQYAPGIGAAALRQAVADHALRRYGMSIDPAAGVVITAGATEAVFASVLGLVDRGDEVIIIEPYFDSYVPNLVMAGATPVYVPLHPPEWTLDPEELRRAFSERTRALILNTPHNPTGRVFTRAELTLIAELCQEHDVTVISDEVYEHLVFGEACHIPIASLPGMAERTVTISSMGKTFSVTGWKIGWVYGAPELIRGVSQAHQFVTFAANHPSQIAAAYALNLPDSYFADFREMYTRKRDLLLSALRGAGMKAKQPEGTYFVMANFAPVFDGDDLEFARYLTTEVGVACIPPTFFYSQDHAWMASTQARFAFCKSDETLQQVGERLARLMR
jgi:N-succinyldiaminopimelate aminotransferase